jgi:hypothetical protein
VKDEERKRTLFLRGFFFWVKGRLAIFWPPSRRTDWISSELTKEQGRGEKGKLRAQQEQRAKERERTESGDVGVRDLGGGEEVVLLEGSGLVKGTVNLVEETESSLGPDDESTEVTSGGELEEVESSDVDELDSGNVSESLGDTVVLVVDDEGSSSLTVSASTHLSLSGSGLPRVGDLDDVVVSLGSLQEGDGLLGLGVGLSGVGDDEGDLLDLLDSVSSGENERWEGGGGESRDDGESLLVLVHLDVPLSPDLGGGEHSSTSAHVSEGGLSSGERGTERVGKRTRGGRKNMTRQ